jgi:hypothetical protein
VLDNYATHKTPAVKRWFLRHPEYRLHSTPTSSSWLNQVERFFGEITEKRIRRGTFRSVASLESAIRDYLEHHNASPKPFAWTADADLILNKLRKVIEPTSNSGHYLDCQRFNDSSSDQLVSGARRRGGNRPTALCHL